MGYGVYLCTVMMFRRMICGNASMCMFFLFLRTLDLKAEIKNKENNLLDLSNLKLNDDKD